MNDRDPAGRVDRAGAVFAALADPTRRAILLVLARQGEASASRLGKLLPVTRQAVVKHLTVLEAAGLVRRREQGRQVLFRVDPRAATEAGDWLHDLAASWDDRLAALRDAAESSPAT